METKRVCVKVSCLRSLSLDPEINLRTWLKSKNNVYVGRRGRIFINKEIFVYKDSLWANKYTVKEYGLEKCLDLYKTHITKMISEDPDLYNIQSLMNKNLGCWCELGQKCHVDILIDLLKNKK